MNELQPEAGTHDPSGPSRSTRRGLLKSLGALSALALGGLGAAAPVAAVPAPLRVALIVPRRSPYPGFATHFEEGLTRALRGSGVVLSLFQTGALPREAQQAARDALDGGAQLLVTLGDGLTAALHPLLTARPVPLIAAEIGVLMPRPGGAATPPLTVTTSLHAWEAEWAHGAHLARSGAGPLHLLISMLDAGYDLPYAFTAGFVQTGGNLTGTTLIDAPTERRTPSELAALACQSGAGAVHVLASGGAPGVIQACRTAGLRVTAGGLSVPPGTAGVLQALAAGSGQARPEWQAALGRAPGPLTTLGFDTGLWLRHALAAAPGHTPLALIAALASTPFDGARGAMKPDAQGRLIAPLFLSAGGTTLQATRPLTRPPAHHPGLDPVRSGWLQTYLHA
ncbi:ABC transporter substrate-binding protein [Deinococcus hopiensis]|uniref:ABC-type sugar transport system, substrate-binding protein, contains N-terminal xre family HTH domain n=1 Tax=Deinococcus hopiensis KR-140 TaxID=695939 RepID=A0A1W1US11_9DEIO|nr:ABC transporter substrate-binding protein [Deinococcus hopiensis]SMB83905.1 ABC-type sugar transport system, substrate-binding protein, contains N-terminal xre family HTH domain [Deinococcus hopiensis KR-140]